MTETDSIDINADPIVVFSSNYCGFCTAAKRLLTTKGVEWKEYLVDGNPELRATMTKMANKTSVPQIWIDGQHIGGCDQLYALEQSGELDPLLGKIKS